MIETAHGRRYQFSPFHARDTNCRANLLTPQSLATLKIEIRPFLFPLAARVIDTCSEGCG
jgi:hypothetical protein